MKKLFVVLGILFFAFGAYSQTKDEPISVVKKRKFYQEEHLLTPSEMKHILSSNPVSADSYSSFKVQSTVSQVFLVTGLGVALGGLLLTDNLGIAAIGIGIELVALPISLSARKKLFLAIDQHNSSVGQSGSRKVNFELMASSTGIGVRMRF